MKKELWERTINLQMVKYQMCVAEFRKLAYECVEAHNLQYPCNQMKNMADSDWPRTYTNSEKLLNMTP